MSGLISRLADDRRGNFSMILAGMVIPVFAAVGFAVDFTNVTRLRAELQDAADTAALVAAKASDKTDAERRALAIEFITSNANLAAAVHATDVELDRDSARVVAHARPRTMIMGMFSTANLDLTIVSEAKNAKQSLEIVFALDVSGSMNATFTGGQTRIAKLREAVSTMVARLEAETSLDISVGLVPFNMNVNIGTRNASLVTGTNNPLFAGTSWKGCVFELPEPDAFRDVTNRKWPAYVWPPMPNVQGGDDWVQNASNGSNDGYGVLSEVGDTSNNVMLDGPNYNCVRQPLQPLTRDLRLISGRLGGLEANPNMGTLIAPAVTWAMRLLSPGRPFTEAKPYSAGARKVMVVVTDGEQTTEAEYSLTGVAESSTNSGTAWTYDPSAAGLAGATIATGYGPVDNLSPYGFIRDSRPFGRSYGDWDALKDDLVRLSDRACAAAKDTTGGRNIEIFTIGVSTDTAPGTRAHTALANCASKPQNHFYASDAAALDAAMNAILEDAKVLRLTH